MAVVFKSLVFVALYYGDVNNLCGNYKPEYAAARVIIVLVSVTA